MPIVDYDPHCPRCNGGIYGTGTITSGSCKHYGERTTYYSPDPIKPEPITSKIPWFRQFEKKRKVNK